jgi:hypothetical protein
VLIVALLGFPLSFAFRQRYVAGLRNWTVFNWVCSK